MGCLWKRAGLAALILFSAAAASAQPAGGKDKSRADTPIKPVANLASIARVDKVPVLEAFLGMQPAPEWAGKLTKLDGFIQANPKDGTSATFRTEAYLGYDARNLYIIFVCFDSEPAKIRARLARRENIYDDDLVQIMLDTFHDRRRAYSFVVNPLGIQLDRLYTENNGFDDSFDTVWDSEGKLTPQGYVVRMAIPFRSLRFPTDAKEWGIVLQRIIPRLDETSYWPRVSSKIDGRLNQEATLNGFDKISPGRNIQLIPYGQFRSSRALNQVDPNAPFFERKRAEFDGGLDAKFVLKDRIVFDVTVNPDFSQVESDQPQVTVNQRFEVFFPEKRPFFLENSNYFDTPISLVFTRRIADPQFGARATGKLGRYAIGMLFADDQSPGRSVPPGDPLYKERAHFGILRVNRDIGKHNTIGMIYTERRVANDFNRVGGLDVHFKWGKNWSTDAQAVTSSTRDTGVFSAGPAYFFWTGYNGRKLNFNTLYLDNSVGFLTRTGFFQRPDIRRFSNYFSYLFRPEGKHLISHGPSAFQQNLWDHHGLPIESFVNVNYRFNFVRQNQVGVFMNSGYERLRPVDYSALTANQKFHTGHNGFFFYTAFFKQVSMDGEIGWGRATNFEPLTGPPVSARDHYAFINLTLHPLQHLSIENRYILSRLRVLNNFNESIFNNHIIRSKWNYQLTRALSLRFITEYDTTLANGTRTSLQTTKNMNYDFLVTYLVHPGTALYVGYNSNLQNLDPSLSVLPSGNLARTRSQFINDGRQFFVKFSYAFRF